MHAVILRLAEDARTATRTAIDADGVRMVLGTIVLDGAGEPGVTRWAHVLKLVRIKTPIPAGAVAIDVVSEARLELDELMLLSAITSAVFSASGGQMVRLCAASADAEAAAVPGEAGTAFRANVVRKGPLKYGREIVPGGDFAITLR